MQIASVKFRITVISFSLMQGKVGMIDKDAINHKGRIGGPV